MIPNGLVLGGTKVTCTLESQLGEWLAPGVCGMALFPENRTRYSHRVDVGTVGRNKLPLASMITRRGHAVVAVDTGTGRCRARIRSIAANLGVEHHARNGCSGPVPSRSRRGPTRAVTTVVSQSGNSRAALIRMTSQ